VTPPQKPNERAPGRRFAPFQAFPRSLVLQGHSKLREAARRTRLDAKLGDDPPQHILTGRYVVSSKVTGSLNPLRFAAPIGVMLALVGMAARAGCRLLKHGGAVVLLAGCAQAPAAPGVFDGTYKGSQLVFRESVVVNAVDVTRPWCLNKSNLAVIIKNDHFDKPWAPGDGRTLSVDIAGDGTFQSEGSFIIGTHPPLDMTIRGRVVGENLEADMSMDNVCAMHLSMKKT
jgi:hypothetical protein